MKIHFQENVIQCTLTNIMSIDEKINEAQKDDANMNKCGNGNFPNQFHCDIC